MYFLSTYFAGQFRLMTLSQRIAEPDETADDLGDFCVFCGRGLAEHDHYCRGCGGIKEMVSMRELKDTMEGTRNSPSRDEGTSATGDEPEVCEPVPEIMQACAAGDAVGIRQRLSGSVNATNSLGETALMWAVRQKRRDLVELLLQGGADPNVRTRNAPNGLRVREGIWAE